MVLQSEERERKRERERERYMLGMSSSYRWQCCSFRLRGVSSSFGIYSLKESFNNIKMDNI